MKTLDVMHMAMTAVAAGLLALIAVAMVGCGGGGDLPGIARCGPTVTACAGERRGTRCATCADLDSSLACQVGGELATCVANCAACDSEPAIVHAPAGDTLALGAQLCLPRRYRESSWCATCDNPNATLAVDFCDSDGFCNPAVCVRTCETCAVAP